MGIDEHLDGVVRALRSGRGVHAVKLLTADEKRRILEAEERAEEKVVYGMCRTLNQGVREALNREYSVAIVMDSSAFEYPHGPPMFMMDGGTVVGEQVDDAERVAELRKDRRNFFLWENFVVYMDKLPRGPGARDRPRLVYVPRRIHHLEGLTSVEDGVYGTPSVEGDVVVKEILAFASADPMMGTCLAGFDLTRRRAEAAG